jgi:outer membrane immunogenic protein
MKLSSMVAGGFALVMSVSAAVADTWDGAYAGISAGFGRSTSTWSNATTFDVTSHGASGGVQTGYNWQSGSIVAGLEADYISTRAKGSSNPCNGSIGFTCSDKLAGIGSIRGRLGWTATPSALIYFTAGVARSLNTHTYTTGALVTSVDAPSGGLAFGGGAEFKLNRNWAVKAEYIYYSFGTVSVSTVTTNFKSAADTFKLGLNYQF